MNLEIEPLQPQSKAIHTLLDCSNTNKIRNILLRKETKLLDACISPWNYRLKKQPQPVLKKIKFLKQIIGVRGRQNHNSTYATEKKILTPQRERHQGTLEPQTKRMSQHNIVNLNQSLEEQHHKRRKDFVLKKHRRFKTLEKS